MRIRSIKPEFCTDEKIGALTREARLHFILLWMAADREGVIENRPRQLAVQLYPYDEDMTNEQFMYLTSAVLQQSLCSVFSVEGREFLKVKNFKKHQSLTSWEKKCSTPVLPLKLLQKYCGSTAEVLHSEERRGEEIREDPPTPLGGGEGDQVFHQLKSRPELHALTFEQLASARQSFATHPRSATLRSQEFADWLEKEAVLMGTIKAPGVWVRSRMEAWVENKKTAPGQKTDLGPQGASM